jgi:hypothetical protein
MYWTRQEHIVFFIVLFVVFTFQVTSFLVLYEMRWAHLTYIMSVVAANILILFGMVKYAQWVWKKLSFYSALRKIAKYEAVFLVLMAGLALLAKVSSGHSAQYFFG